MKTFRFLDFKVYKESKVFYQNILKSSETLKIYSLKDQIRRASLSIVLNIAEGSARKSDKEFGRFLQLSLGSVNEVVACLDLMKENELISAEDYEGLLNESADIARQLGGFYKKLVS